MAGGLGSRIASLNPELPKPMLRLDGRPVLEYGVECLKRQGISDFIFVVGYKHEAIQSYFKDGREFGVQIRYLVEETPLGTAGALYFLKDMLEGEEDFLLINGDIIFDVDVNRFYKKHRQYGGTATIFTHPNNHPFDSTVVETGKDGRVTGWIQREEKRKWYQNRVNAGIHMFSSTLFDWMKANGMLEAPQKRNLDRDILSPLMEAGLLYAYDSPEYVKDMGTPERYLKVEEDIREKRVEKRNLFRKQKAVFLDRDGTINEYVGFLTEIEQFRLLKDAGAAIRKLNEEGWLVIVVTNQPVIARGEISIDQLEEIHKKMETLLGEEGAYVDAVYYCPHHPDSGFEGERREYKIICGCRKPKPGMLLRAAEEYHIDLSLSWMAGDSDTDIQAGRAAGCHTAGLYGCRGEKTFENLKAFADFLCSAE